MMKAQQRQLKEKISSITQKLEELKQRWPAHSVKPSMVEELDQLEDELEQLQKKLLRLTVPTDIEAPDR